MMLKYKLQLLLSVSCLSCFNTSLFAMMPNEEKENPKPPAVSSLIQQPHDIAKKQDCSGSLEGKSSTLEDQIIDALGVKQRDGFQGPLSSQEDVLNVNSLVTFLEDQSGLYYVPQAKARDLCGWDAYGFVKLKENALGNHRVVKRGSLHFKLSPGGGYDDEGVHNDIRPGLELSVSSFFKCLTMNRDKKQITVIAPPSTLLVLNNIKIKNIEDNFKVMDSPYPWVRKQFITGKITCVEEFLSRNPDVKQELEQHMVETGKRTLFQVSQTIEGALLKDVLEDPNAYRDLCENLDPLSFSSLFIGTLLTKPSDGGLANYIVYKQENHKYGIACIDNDESWVSPITPLKSGNHFPNLKAFLFFSP